MKKQLKNDFWIGISALIIYFVMTMTGLQTLPFKILHISISNLPEIIRTLYSLLYETLILSLLILLFKERLEKDLMDLKKNHKTYFHNYFKYWFLLLGLMMISNLLINLIHSLAGIENSIAGNEEAIRDLFNKAPIYTYISAVMIAPFLEELTFRLGIRYIFKKDIVFIIISGIVFGLLHVIGNVAVPLDWLYIIPYSIPGFIFAYILTKTNNIFTTIAMHFVHNGMLMSLQFLLFFFL